MSGFRAPASVPVPAPSDQGKPRIRDASSWWLDHEDGTVTLVQLRRDMGSHGGWREVLFRGNDEAEALARYDESCAQGYLRSHRQHERMQKWGPREVAT